MDNIENNKLIAAFMGKVFKNKYGLVCEIPEGIMFLDRTLYHSSWSWLMPVVGKIAACKYAGGVTYDIHNTLAIADIDATYKAVVEFIKWYNKREKK